MVIDPKECIDRGSVRLGKARKSNESELLDDDRSIPSSYTTCVRNRYYKANIYNLALLPCYFSPI